MNNLEIKSKRPHRSITFAVFCVLVLSLPFFLISCKKEESMNGQDRTYTVYFLNPDGYGLVSEDYTAKSAPDNTVEVIEDILKYMQTNGRNGKFLSPLEADLEVIDFQIKETQLSVYFSVIYNNRSGIDEILSRAAIVKTLCQIDGVDSVEFYVEDQPLMLEGNAVGLMSADSFVDNLDPEYTQQSKQVTLYFSNSSGKKLQEVTTEVEYNSSEPLAQLLVEKLIEGPQNLKGKSNGLLVTIPGGTRINNLTIRDNICYLDLSRDFTYPLSEVNSNVIIYSIVNTLCNLSNVTKVQFTIDGEQKEVFGETKNFNTPFERDLDLIESESESR